MTPDRPAGEVEDALAYAADQQMSGRDAFWACRVLAAEVRRLREENEGLSKAIEFLDCLATEPAARPNTNAQERGQE